MAKDREYVDVLIIGAGLSGIGAAARLATLCPNKTFTVLESRQSIGGTWDLFRYPGVRSDSDMYTFAYPFKPWRGADAIGSGAAIREYIAQTAEDYAITDRIRFQHRVVAAGWSTRTRTWTITAERGDTGESVAIEAAWLIGATGYYSYDRGYRPAFEGEDRFHGTTVHPQQWPEELDYSGKNIAVIGSGATAVTLVPALAGKAKHVTMVQRTPTYIASVPQADPLAGKLRGRLPDRLVDPALRWKNALGRQLQYSVSRAKPAVVRSKIRQGAAAALPADYDVDTHFNPPYDPWDQRVCAVPDGDLFKAISAGSASIVTDRIRTFTEHGLETESGQKIDADIVVTATGLNLRWLGGMRLTSDGHDIDTSHRFAYKGMMLSGVPNFNVVVGYTNNSWTLKADLVNQYVCQLLNYMDAKGFDTATPTTPFGESPRPLLDLDAGYIRRGVDAMAKQGTREPWRLHQNYLKDRGLFSAKHLDDGLIDFAAKTSATAPPAQSVAGEAVAGSVDSAGSVYLVEVGGGRVRYRSEGRGTPVVMVHGIARSLEDWDEQHRLLADSGYRVISLDLAGFGDSTPLQEPYSLPALARFLEHFLAAIEVDEPAHLVGNSLGGGVVMQLAVQAPARVASLVLVDPVGFGREVASFIRLMAVRPVARFMLRRPSLAMARRIERSVFHDKRFVTNERVGLSHRLASRPEGARVLLETVSALGTARGVSEGWRRDLLNALRALHLRTLVVWGVDDEILPVAHLSKVKRSLPHARTHAFAAAGHMPQIECAEEFCGLATDFWAECKTPRRQHAEF